MKKHLFVPAAVVAVVLAAIPAARAEKWDPDTITEKDKQTYQDFVAGMKKGIEARKNRARQATAINNLRQIGIALFEFETEYGEFPNEDTAGPVKEATETKADLKAATANDCFFQVIAAGIVQDHRIFTIAGEEDPARKNAAMPERLEKCAFSYLIGMNAAGNPSRPVVIAPLVKGKETFDPVALGGKAVILRVDNSVQTAPIDKDGRVMINGKDLFDPEQPFWNGDVPEIRWPKD